MSTLAYPVTVSREDALWVAIVTAGLEEGIVGAADFEDFADVDPGIREVIADLTDTGPDDFEIDWNYEFAGADHTTLVREYQNAERAAGNLVHWRDAARSRLVTELNGNLPQRAVANLIGLSHQRVHQIGHEPAPAVPDPRALGSSLVHALKDFLAYATTVDPDAAQVDVIRPLQEILIQFDTTGAGEQAGQSTKEGRRSGRREATVN